MCEKQIFWKGGLFPRETFDTTKANDNWPKNLQAEGSAVNRRTLVHDIPQVAKLVVTGNSMKNQDWSFTSENVEKIFIYQNVKNSFTSFICDE